MKFTNAVVIGTGMMGPGIACTLALGGVSTAVASRTAEGARRGLNSALAGLHQLEENGLIQPAQAATAAPLLSCTHDLDSAAQTADLIVESAPENMAFKQDLFRRLDALTPVHAVLATNTSGLSITVIASACSHPERVLTTHFWNPPHLMPLVEIVRSERTSDDVVASIRVLLRQCGKVPVLVKKDRPGQLGNRLQMALVREAVHIVQEGIAEAEDVDTAAKLGFGMRLPVYGILEHQDMVGLPLGFAVCDYVAADLNNDPHAPELFRTKIANGETGASAGQGFHRWTPESVQAVKDRRDRFIIDCLRRMLFS